MTIETQSKGDAFASQPNRPETSPVPAIPILPAYTGASSAQPLLRRHLPWLLAPLVLMALLALWELLVWLGDYPTFVLPAPRIVAAKFAAVLADGSLLRHTAVTLREVLLGLLFGVGAGLLLGYALGKNRTIERLVSPYLVTSQSVPIVAIAPLLVIWFGNGLLSKVLVCALITFFPTLISTIVGIRSVDADLRDVMRSLQATRWQHFRLLELPSALPVIFAGLKLSVILAVVGAVVGELIGANAGLGYLINLARGVFDTPLIFVAILGLVLIAQLLYLTVALIEWRLLRWQAKE